MSFIPGLLNRIVNAAKDHGENYPKVRLRMRGRRLLVHHFLRNCLFCVLKRVVDQEPKNWGRRSHLETKAPALTILIYEWTCLQIQEYS